MRCETVTERLDDLLDDEVGPSEKAGLERHLAGCEGCREELEGLRKVVQLARSLPREVPGESGWNALAAELPDRHQPTPTRLWPPVVLVLAIAAGVFSSYHFLLPHRFI